MRYRDLVYLESRLENLRQILEEQIARQTASRLREEGKALASIDHRLDSMNEFREEIHRIQLTFITQAVFNAHLGVTDRIIARLSQLEEYSANIKGRLWAFAAAFSGALTLLTAIYYILHVVNTK